MQDRAGRRIEPAPERDIERCEENRSHRRDGGHRDGKRRISTCTLGDKIRDIAPRTGGNKDQAQRDGGLRRSGEDEKERQNGQHDELREQSNKHGFWCTQQPAEIVWHQVNRDREHDHRENAVEQQQLIGAEIQGDIINHALPPFKASIHLPTARR